MRANPFAWSFRAQFAFGFLACVGLLAYALYLQYWQYLDPCPLCIFQRYAFVLLAIVFALGAIVGPTRAGGRKAFGLLAFASATIGIGIAGWHVYLQTLPPSDVPACGPGLEFLWQTNSLGGVLGKVFTGSGECATIDWTFLGLAMPAWALVWFVLLGAGALWAGFRAR